MEFVSSVKGELGQEFTFYLEVGKWLYTRKVEFSGHCEFHFH